MQGSVLRPILFSLFFMICLLLCLLPSAVLLMLTIWPFGPSPLQSLLQWRPHEAHWCEYWCLPLNLSKCEAFFFSADHHQANLQPNLLLLNSRLHFNPTSTFLGVTFDCTLSFSKHVPSLKAKFFPCLKVLHCISASSLGPSRIPSLFCIKLFFGPFSLTSRRGFT